MVYGIDTTPFNRLKERVDDLLPTTQALEDILSVYHQTPQVLLIILMSKLNEGTKAPQINLAEFINAIRDVQVALELTELGTYLLQSEDSDPKEHFDKASAITKSIKKLIEKHTQWQELKSVMHKLKVLIATIKRSL